MEKLTHTMFIAYVSQSSLGLKHDYLIPVLVNAVKELSDEVDILKAEIAELKKSL